MSLKSCIALNIIFLLHKGVLLLQALTRSNGAIQKIVAFENAFERLLDIITEEGNSDGGIVWRDWFEKVPFALIELLTSEECNWREKGGLYAFFVVVLLDVERGFPGREDGCFIVFLSSSVVCWLWISFYLSCLIFLRLSESVGVFPSFLEISAISLPILLCHVLKSS